MSGHVFLSYSRRNKKFVHKLARDLRARGIDVWVDMGDIRGGTDWAQALEEAIKTASAVILVMSKHSLRSKYVYQEIEWAEQANKAIIPLDYKKTKIPAALGAKLGRYQFIDLRSWGYDRSLTDIIAALEGQNINVARAPEASDSQRRQRWEERLGAEVKVSWREVWKKVPRWALSWGYGWAIVWIILPFILVAFAESEFQNPILLPLGGFAGGLVGGLIAGTLTMIALRHFVTNMSISHMPTASTMIGLWGPIAAAVAGGFVAASISASSSPDCGGLSFGDCLGQSIGFAIGQAFLLILGILFYGLLAFIIISALSAWRTVRRIKQMEPGIKPRHTFWVMVAWSIGGLAAALASIIAIAFTESL